MGKLWGWASRHPHSVGTATYDVRGCWRKIAITPTTKLQSRGQLRGYAFRNSGFGTRGDSGHLGDICTARFIRD